MMRKGILLLYKYSFQAKGGSNNKMEIATTKKSKIQNSLTRASQDVFNNTKNNGIGIASLQVLLLLKSKK